MKTAWPIAMTLAVGLHIGAAALTACFGPRAKAVQPRLSIRFKSAERPPPVSDKVALSKPKKLAPGTSPLIGKRRPRRVPRKRRVPPPSRALLAPAQPAKPPYEAPVASPGPAPVQPGAQLSPSPKAAPVQVAKAEAPESQPPDLKLARRRLLSALAGHKRYPRRARRLKQQGVVLLQVVLTGAGTLAEPARVLKSSGYKMLDREALRMVAAAAPFDALPGGLDSAAFEVPLRFALK